jgi:hypothetical protein
MCFDCFDDDENQPLRITEQLIAYTREIEEDMPGDPVSDEAWAIFFGRQGGSLLWKDHERMARCREAATVMLSMSARERSVSEAPETPQSLPV